jgi:hypothetical protein
MEKFMLIFHGGRDGGLSPEQMQAHMGKWMAWVKKLSQADKYVSGEPLIPGGKLVTGKNSITDGPFTEGKEVVGGYFIVKANNYDDAVALCKDYPGFEYGGSVQVRQVQKMEMPEPAKQ